MTQQDHPGDEAQFTQDELDTLAHRTHQLFDIQDRKHGFPPKTYLKCFVGREAVQVLIKEGFASDHQDALRIGNILLSAGIFHHVQQAHPLRDDYLFYRFARDEDHGRVATKPDGSKVSWADFLGSASPVADSLQPRLPDRDDRLGEFPSEDLKAIGVAPLDSHNARLLDHTHPAGWEAPDPTEKYNLVVIGAGTGGLVSAAAAGLGARVALVESHLLGGDCLNVGCVPSKALLRSARAAAALRRAEEFGIRIEGQVSIDFPAVMERLRRIRADISPHDSAERFARLGVDVFLGRGTFASPDSVQVNGKTLRFSKAVIATGGTAAIPPIPGLREAPFLTNASVFNLTQLPPRLGVIGAGPIGLELAQAFCRLGSAVTVFSRRAGVLPKEDPEAAKIVADSLRQDGVELEYRVNYTSIESRGSDGPIRVVFEQGGAERSIEFDRLLVAAGRKPAVGDLGLDIAGIDYDARTGIKVNDRLQTSNSSVYSVGDVATQFQFTHVADFMARLVVRNALFLGREKFSSLLIPWSTYTDPEVAHVGLYERDLEEQGIEYQTLRRNFSEVDRSILDGETSGFVKIHVRKGKDEILGATIVATHAGEMISEISVAIQAGMGIGKLASVIHPYPTAAEAIRQCGDAYNRGRLTPTVRAIFSRLMSLQR